MLWIPSPCEPWNSGLLPLWQVQTFSWTPSRLAVVHSPPSGCVHAANPSPLPGIWPLKPEPQLPQISFLSLFLHTHFIAGIKIEQRLEVNYLNCTKTSVFKKYFVLSEFIMERMKTIICECADHLNSISKHINPHICISSSLCWNCNCFSPCWKILSSYSLMHHSCALLFQHYSNVNFSVRLSLTLLSLKIGMPHPPSLPSFGAAPALFLSIALTTTWHTLCVVVISGLHWIECKLHKGRSSCLYGLLLYLQLLAQYMWYILGPW